MRFVSEIPLPYQSVFAPHEVFYAAQAEVLDDVLYSDNHLIVSAPTGSGKTTILELAIVELLIYLENISNNIDDVKIVYVAPTRALCKEIFVKWEQKFKSVHLKCVLVTGHTSEFTELDDIRGYHIIITTPEKWYALTRSWRDHKEIVESIKLMLIDEVHLLGDESRGPTLEALVCRMKSFADEPACGGDKSRERALRFVAVSGTIPNIDSLAEWIKTKSRVDCKTFQIAENKRPIKLERVVYGFPSRNNSFEFDTSLSYKLPEIIQKHDCGKPILVFCQTRYSIEHTLQVLLSRSNICRISESEKQVLKLLSAHLKDDKLRSALPHGMAFHHAGLGESDRNLVENMFRNRQIKLLLCTSTLAMGVNLPAHLVIIKSTEVYHSGKAKEMERNLLLQMVGRAGRPQYDDSGKVIILTSDQKTTMYRNLVSATTPIESSLHKQLAANLNSEIVLHTINDFADAMKWMRSTFLYVRAVANPTYYGIQSKCAIAIENALKELCLANIRLLHEVNLVSMDEYYEIVQSTDFGKIMARFFVSLNTMKEFAELCGTESTMDIFNKIVSSNEFAMSFRLRNNEKKPLNEICKKLQTKVFPKTLPPIGTVKNSADKVACLLQATLSQIEITDAGFEAEATEMMELAERLSKCLVEYFIAEDFVNKKFQSLISSHLMAKCFQMKTWNFASAEKKAAPKYKMTVEFVSDEKFAIAVEHSQTHQNIGEEAISSLTLVVGDTENNLFVHSEDINFHLEKSGSYETSTTIKGRTAFIEAYLIDHRQDCDLFARVIPSKGNRVIAKPYTVSIFDSRSKQDVPLIELKPGVRTIRAVTTKNASSAATATTTSMKSTRASAVQTKLNDFFKKPQPSHKISRPTVQPGYNTSLDRAPQYMNIPSENLISLQGQTSSQKMPPSIGETQTPLAKLRDSPKLLSSRSQLYDFDDSFMSTQFSEVDGRQNYCGANSLKLKHSSENVPRPELETPIRSKLLKAMNNGDEFVSAKTIFNDCHKGASLPVEDWDDDPFDSPFSFTRKEYDPPKNIVACLESSGIVLPKHHKRLEQSIADILNCKVDAVSLNRKYRSEFEMDAINHYEQISLPPSCTSDGLIATQMATSTVRPKEKGKEHLCDTFFSTDSAEWPISPIPASTTRSIDSPILARKKPKPAHDFRSQLAFNEIGASGLSKRPQNTIDGDVSIDQHQHEFADDGDWEERFDDISAKEVSPIDRFASEKTPSNSNYDEHRQHRQDSRNWETFWSNEDDSPDTNKERKMSIIDEMVANRGVRGTGDAKNQMRKPSGKAVQARVTRVRHKIRTESLNRSWDPSYAHMLSKEDRNREFIRQHILRLPEETCAQWKEDANKDDEILTFDWFSD